MFYNHNNLKILISIKKDGSMRLIGDDVKNNLENRQKYFNKNKIDQEKVVSTRLAGGNKVKIVGNKDGGRIIKNIDGLITADKGLFFIYYCSGLSARFFV